MCAPAPSVCSVRGAGNQTQDFVQKQALCQRVTSLALQCNVRSGLQKWAGPKMALNTEHREPPAAPPSRLFRSSPPHRPHYG